MNTLATIPADLPAEFSVSVDLYDTARVSNQERIEAKKALLALKEAAMAKGYTVFRYFDDLTLVERFTFRLNARL